MATFDSFDKLKAAMKSRSAYVDLAMAKATIEHTTDVYMRCKDLLQELIYDKPIDTYSYSWAGREHVDNQLPKRVRQGPRYRWTASKKFAERKQRGGMGFQEGQGRPKWNRSGDLAKFETMRFYGANGLIANRAGYALPRHDLGLSPGETDAINGSSQYSDRKAPWRRRAVREAEPERLRRYRDALWVVLTR